MKNINKSYKIRKLNELYNFLIEMDPNREPSSDLAGDPFAYSIFKSQRTTKENIIKHYWAGKEFIEHFKKCIKVGIKPNDKCEELFNKLMIK